VLPYCLVAHLSGFLQQQQKSGCPGSVFLLIFFSDFVKPPGYGRCTALSAAVPLYPFENLCRPPLNRLGRKNNHRSE
jgi:hypothetical protein